MFEEFKPVPRSLPAIIHRHPVATALVATVICAGLAAADCYVESVRACSASYIQVPDGCPDTPFPTDSTTWMSIPGSDLAQSGWTSFQATGPCTYYVQVKVPTGGDPPGCVNSGEQIQMTSSGRMGAGETCITED